MKLSPKKTAFRVSLGARGEMIACDFLRKQGFRILEKNFRCRLGEIDVIAERGGRLRFIEIKTRAGSGFGRPEEAVHAAKQKKLVSLALWYLKGKKKTDVPVSFDVLAVELRAAGEPAFHLIEDAFEAGPGTWVG